MATEQQEQFRSNKTALGLAICDALADLSRWR